MSEAVKYEQVLVGVRVISDVHQARIFVGEEKSSVEVFSLKIIKNTEELFTVKAYDEDGYVIYTLNIFKPLVVEVFEKTIAVDGPTETK